jgi:hypothetical protein
MTRHSNFTPHRHPKGLIGLDRNCYASRILDQGAHLPRPTCTGCIFFHTHRNPEVFMGYILMSCRVCNIVSACSPSRTRYFWELVQLPTVPFHDLLQYHDTNATTSVVRSSDIWQHYRCFGIWMGVFESVRPGGRMSVICFPSFHIRVRIFGMLCIQVWRYYQRYPNDHWSYKVLVRPCCVCFIRKWLTPFVFFSCRS